MPKCTRLILIAEDDPDDQELIAFAFAKADPSLRLYIVNDGKEAIHYLQNLPDNALPCVIILDYNMPELNGAQVLQQLAPDRRFDSVPKIILSTSDNPVYMKEALQKGADDYKIKPDDFQKLISIAREMADLCESAA